MTSNSTKLADFLRKIADAIEPLDAPSLDAFLRQNSVPIASDVGKNDRESAKASGGLSKKTPKAKTAGRVQTKRKKSQSPPSKGLEELRNILSELQNANARDVGTRVLKNHKLIKADLIALAKLADVHIMKNDTVSRLEEKLVETLIGSRLNSQAIRGTLNLPD
ncbi:hypothetical protein [Agrobacterium larrymoorei]|uniref:Uncharacterized protein n=1 Tax=Agrobacterium larrymoorei TaxID=160699 RepID=A0AAF0KEJ1_9HYPH|nr:hypothetical protein [Agrobacterium larrymoorei]WHA41921.1 hypothetical protein CFBP5477_004635 [Agrobacterium larrymoorei]